MSKNKELLKKDDIVQAVLIADDFSEEFDLVTKNTPFVSTSYVLLYMYFQSK